MFTGIIERVCKVRGVRPSDAVIRLEIELAELLNGIKLGASVAINGVCLTLAERHGVNGLFDVVPETWRTTTLGTLRLGDRVNAERSLQVGDRLDGHFVQGHVDGIGKIDRLERQSGEYKIWISVDAALLPYLIRKGSVTIDGTSLTIVEVEPERFSVVLIPTTLEHTVLHERQPGDGVNIETDILSRVIVSRLEAMSAGSDSGGRGLTWERLLESGFGS